jgi:hypothetical protein
MSLMRLSHNPPSPESFQIHLFVRQRIPFQILFYLRQQAGSGGRVAGTWRPVQESLATSGLSATTHRTAAAYAASVPATRPIRG